MTQVLSEPPSFLELVHQPVVGPQGEVHSLGFVVVRVQVEVLDNVCQEVGSLPTAPRHFIAQLGEVDVQVVVGRLVVQVDPELAGLKLVALQDGLLECGKTRRLSERRRAQCRLHRISACVHWSPYLSLLVDVLQQR